jgi:hypothetical protein
MNNVQSSDNADADEDNADELIDVKALGLLTG